MSGPQVFLASSHHSLVDVDHGDKLGLLLEQLVEQGAVAPAKDQQVLLCIVLQEMTLTRLLNLLSHILFFFRYLNSFTHERMGVDEIGLGKVGEAVEDENVAEVEGGVDLDQLVGRPLREEQLLPSHLQQAVV